MGPMLVAILVVLYLAFAALSASVGVVFGIIGFRMVIAKTNLLLGLYVLGSGFLGAAAAIGFGILQQWNVIGTAIMAQPLIGFPAWGAIGFGWSTAAAFVVGSLLRHLASTKRGRLA
jgi:hypothetical protein